MISHASALMWSYLILAAGVCVLALGIVAAIHGARSTRSPEDIALKKRMETLEDLRRAGEISRDEYNRRRAELLVERYKKQAS